MPSSILLEGFAYSVFFSIGDQIAMADGIKYIAFNIILTANVNKVINIFCGE